MKSVYRSERGLEVWAWLISKRCGREKYYIPLSKTQWSESDGTAEEPLAWRCSLLFSDARPCLLLPGAFAYGLPMAKHFAGVKAQV